MPRCIGSGSPLPGSWPGASADAARRHGRSSPHSWSAVLALPLATIVVLSLTAPAENVWPHLMRTVLPAALADTAVAAAGVRP